MNRVRLCVTVGGGCNGKMTAIYCILLCIALCGGCNGWMTAIYCVLLCVAVVMEG